MVKVELLDKKTESIPKSTPKSTQTYIPKSRINKEKEFIKNNKQTLIDALNWAINTIKNKKEVKEQDSSKQYYRTYSRWKEVLIELEKLEK